MQLAASEWSWSGNTPPATCHNSRFLSRVSWKIEQQGKPRQANVQLSVKSYLMSRIFASGDGGLENETPQERFASLNYLNPVEVCTDPEALSSMPSTTHRLKSWSLLV